jgi:hypothetical protein
MQIGNKWIAEQALNNGISDDDDFDIIIESVAYPRSPLDYSDDLISEFEINRLHLNEPDKLEMIQKAYQSAQGKRKFLLRIRETGVNVDLICSVSKFAGILSSKIIVIINNLSQLTWPPET